MLGQAGTGARAKARSTGLQPDQLVSVEAFADAEDEMWLGKTAAFDNFGLLCCQKHTGALKNAHALRQ